VRLDNGTLADGNDTLTLAGFGSTARKYTRPPLRPELMHATIPTYLCDRVSQFCAGKLADMKWIESLQIDDAERTR
jgi:hypothetical protein